MQVFVEAATADGTVRFVGDEDQLAGVGPERVSRHGGHVIASLNGSLDEALAHVRPAAESVVAAFRALSPDEVSVEFGLQIDAEAGALIAKTAVGAHFTIQLRWSREAELSEPASAAP